MLTAMRRQGSVAMDRCGRPGFVSSRVRSTVDATS